MWQDKNLVCVTARYCQQIWTIDLTINSGLHTSARKSVMVKPEPSQASFAAALSFLAANWFKKPATILTASPLSLSVSMSSSCAGVSIDLAMLVRRSLGLLPPLTATSPYSFPTYSDQNCLHLCVPSAVPWYSKYRSSICLIAAAWDK